MPQENVDENNQLPRKPRPPKPPGPRFNTEPVYKSILPIQYTIGFIFVVIFLAGIIIMLVGHSPDEDASLIASGIETPSDIELITELPEAIPTGRDITGKSIEAISFDSASTNEEIADGIEEVADSALGHIYDQAWIRFDNVRFSPNVKTFVIQASSKKRGARVEARLDAPDGLLIASTTVPPLNSWRNLESFSAECIDEIPAGDLYIVFHALDTTRITNLINLKSFAFEE